MKKAFTMAEVLITIGVIGIVASMTLPSALGKYEKIRVANQIKKMYSVMSQAIRLAEEANGEFKYWTYNSAEELYNFYLAKHLNTIKTEYSIHFSGAFTNGIRLVFEDGTQAVCAYKANIKDYGNQVEIPICIFSPKAVQKWEPVAQNMTKKGTHEFFWFFITEKGTLEPPHLDKSREYNIQQCRDGDSATQNHYTDCSTLLYKDNWKFRDDYPW